MQVSLIGIQENSLFIDEPNGILTFLFSMARENSERHVPELLTGFFQKDDGFRQFGSDLRYFHYGDIQLTDEFEMN